MSRVTNAHLLAIAETMPEPEREILRVVDRLRLASHDQLARLISIDNSSPASPVSLARMTRRLLRRLTDLGALARLERRIGGVRAGSAGHVYYVGPVGQRLLAYWNGEGLVRGRVRPDPGARYVRHRLAVSELYVAASEAEARGELDVLAFDVEPDCWRTSLDGLGSTVTLKPDAFLCVGLGAYEDRWFVEVDLGTESRTVIARKLRAYLDHFHTGHEQAEHGVFPRVLILTSTEARRASLVETVTAVPAEYWQIFALNTLSNGVAVISGLTEQAAHDVSTGGAA